MSYIGYQCRIWVHTPYENTVNRSIKICLHCINSACSFKNDFFPLFCNHNTIEYQKSYLLVLKRCQKVTHLSKMSSKNNNSMSMLSLSDRSFPYDGIHWLPLNSFSKVLKCLVFLLSFCVLPLEFIGKSIFLFSQWKTTDGTAMVYQWS